MSKWAIAAFVSLLLVSLAFVALKFARKDPSLDHTSQADVRQNQASVYQASVDQSRLDKAALDQATVDEATARPVRLEIDRKIAMPKGWEFYLKNGIKSGLHISGNLLVANCCTTDKKQSGILRVDLSNGKADVIHKKPGPKVAWIRIVGKRIVYAKDQSWGKTKLEFLDKASADSLGELELETSRISTIINLSNRRLFLSGEGEDDIRDQAFEIDVRSMKVTRSTQATNLQDGDFDPKLNRIFTISAYPGYISTFDVKNWRVLKQKESDWFYGVATKGRTAYGIATSGLSRIDIDKLTVKVIDSKRGFKENVLVSTSLGPIIYRKKGKQEILLLNDKGVAARYLIAKLDGDGSGMTRVVGGWNKRIVALHNNRILLTKAVVK